MFSTPTKNDAAPRRSSRINAVKAGVSPRIKASLDNVKAAISPKIKASINRVKAAVSPSNILDACRRVSRRTTAKAQSTSGMSTSLRKNIIKSPAFSDVPEGSAGKLRPDEVKQQLGECSRLDILRSRLLKINKCGSKVRDFKKDMEAVDAEDQANNNYEKPKQLVIKTVEPKIIVKPDPAYERYMHLVAKPEEGLVLPAKHKVLNDYFRAVDTVISLLYNRQEVVTSSKVHSAVQAMMKKNFSQDILAKIKTVFPEGYTFSQDKTKTILGNLEYSLVVNPCFQYKTSDPTHLKMTSVVLNERRNIFLNSLIQMIKVHHDKFISTLDEPVVPTDNLKRWHPEFDLAEVPDVELSSLPQPPADEKFDNAVDVLSKAMDIFSLGAGESNATALEPKQKIVTDQAPKVNSALKGISSSLIEKIRAREAARASLSALSKSKSQSKELDMLTRLPEVARILRNTFITERKVALPWEMMVNKVSATFSATIHDRDVDGHLHRLIKESPGWLTVCKVSSGTYLKINKAMDVNDIIETLKSLIKSKQ